MHIKIDVITCKSFLAALDKAVMVPIDRRMWSVFCGMGGSQKVLVEMIDNYIACDFKTGNKVGGV